MSLSTVAGMPITINDNLGRINYRPARPHKSKRIAKKWLQRFGTTFDYEPYIQIIRFPAASLGYGNSHDRDQVICNTAGLEKLKEELNER